MDIRHLRYFIAIADEGSFSRAAERVNVAQPALSAHVRRMEAELDVELLVRSPKGVEPTDAGKVLLNRARLLIADFESTLQDARGIGREPTGTVRVGLPGTISDILSLPLIVETRRRYPDIKLLITEAMSGYVKEWVLEGRVDLAVLYSQGNDAGLLQERLLEEELVVLMPPESGFRDHAVLDILSHEPLILPGQEHGLRVAVDRYLLSLGLQITPEIEVDSYNTIKLLVQGGFGCSVLPSRAVAKEAGEGLLSVRHFETLAFRRYAHLAVSSSRTQTRAALAVGEILKDQVAYLINENRWIGAALS